MGSENISIKFIYHHFDSEVSVKQIWINSWEFSLLSTPEESSKNSDKNY